MKRLIFAIALLTLASLAWAQPPYSQNSQGFSPQAQQGQQDDPPDAADHGYIEDNTRRINGIPHCGLCFSHKNLL
jgi:hypothetical protein